MKRLIDGVISPVKRFHGNITCLFDLPNEILLLICGYMSIFDILHCFYTPEYSTMRLHRLISDYYTKINVGAIKYDKLNYFINLFSHSDYPLRPESLTLSNEYVFSFIQHYFSLMPKDTTQSIFVNLMNLKLLDCSPNDLNIIDHRYTDLTKLQSIHLTIRKSNDDNDFPFEEKSDTFINRMLFSGQMSNLHTIIIQSFDGLSLYKCLTPHQNLCYVNIFLKTIDDLFILLNGFIPNVKTLIVQLRQSRFLECHHPQSKPLCSRLINFTLIDNHIGIVINDIKSIFGYMTNLNKLTLSIRDTTDPIFCHGHKFESMLMEHLPRLHKFDYTMTHRINDKTVIEDFIRWSMDSVFYENEGTKWIHIYSFPWPSSRQDKRELPIINGTYNILVTSDIKSIEYMNDVNITREDDMLEIKKRFSQIRQLQTCLSIDIILPRRISKLILNKETPIGSINSIPQLSICHLIVKRRLIDENEILTFAHQFPNVKYLELLFPLKEERFLLCFKTLFSLDDTNEKRCFWSEMINFRTLYSYEQSYSLGNDKRFHHWLILNTDLKYHSISFYANHSNSMLSIWL